MNIALAPGSITLTKADGSTQTINASQVVDVTAHSEPVFTPVTFDTDLYQTSVPQVWDPSTATWSNKPYSSTTQWYILIHLGGDWRPQRLNMGEQTGDGSTWVNTLNGANIAVDAIKDNFFPA